MMSILAIMLDQVEGVEDRLMRDGRLGDSLPEGFSSAAVRVSLS